MLKTALTVSLPTAGAAAFDASAVIIGAAVVLSLGVAVVDFALKRSRGY